MVRYRTFQLSRAAGLPSPPVRARPSSGRRSRAKGPARRKLSTLLPQKMQTGLFVEKIRQQMERGHFFNLPAYKVFPSTFPALIWKFKCVPHGTEHCNHNITDPLSSKSTKSCGIPKKIDSDVYAYLITSRWNLVCHHMVVQPRHRGDLANTFNTRRALRLLIRDPYTPHAMGVKSRRSSTIGPPALQRN